MRQTLLAKAKRPNSFVALGAVAAALFFSGADAGAGTELPEGSLALTTSAEPSFAATLNGYDQTKTYTIPSVLADTRDSGGGWSTTITSTRFKTADGKTLPKDASSVTSVANTCRSGGTCTPPRASVSLPVPVPAGQNATPVKYFNSALDTGVGVFDHVPTVSVELPANALAGHYESTVTVASVSGP
jgi:hypothetical protein